MRPFAYTWTRSVAGPTFSDMNALNDNAADPLSKLVPRVGRIPRSRVNTEATQVCERGRRLTGFSALRQIEETLCLAFLQEYIGTIWLKQ